MSAPPLALLDPATAQLLLAPPVAMRPGGNALSRSYSDATADASPSDTARMGAIFPTSVRGEYGPGSYGDWPLGGSTGNHSLVRSGPSDLSRRAMTSGVSVKLSVCVMSPLTISESIGVHGFGP